MTREILKLIRKKRRRWRTAKNSALEQDMRECKRIEKEVAKKVRNAKRKMEKDLVKDVDKNNRKYKKYVKSKTKSKTQSKTTVGPLVTKEKEIIADNKEMAEELNKFFSSVFTQEDLTTVPDAEPENVRHAMPPVHVSQQDVVRKRRRQLVRTESRLAC
jgi:hypothetical protein